MEDDNLKSGDDMISLRRLCLRETSSKMDVDEAYDDMGKTALLSSVVADNYTSSCEASLHQNRYAVTLMRIMQPLSLKAEHGSLYETNLGRDSPDSITGEAGEEVVLSCPVNTPECGDFHFLKWYRDSNRGYVYSPAAEFSNADGDLMDRCLDDTQSYLGAGCVRGHLIETDTSADLGISLVSMKDGGEFRGEITYLDLSNNCPVVPMLDGEPTVTSVEVVELEREHSGSKLQCFVMNQVLEELITAEVQVDANVPVVSVY